MLLLLLLGPDLSFHSSICCVVYVHVLVLSVYSIIISFHLYLIVCLCFFAVDTFVQVLGSQLLLVDEVMKAGKQMGQAPPGGPGGMMEE